MPDIYYQHPDTWFGDCMPFFHDGAFYLFHQRDGRDPGPLPDCEPFGWALARTTDFVTYEDFGEVIIRGGEYDQDQFIYAGSVHEAGGTFYAMYTGYNRDHFEEQGKASQVLMVAESDDLVHWTKTGKTIAVPQPGYDPDDWRDPWVIHDEEKDQWVMIVGTRYDGPKSTLTGSTVYFTSDDHENWTFRGDFWASGLYTMHEMPDIFREGDRWYHLVTEYSEKSKTIYRSSDSLYGPWTADVDDAFDGRAYYAARSASDGEHRYLFGWVPTQWDDDDQKPWQWGGTLVVHEVVKRPDGTLGAKIPDGVLAHLQQQTVAEVEPFALERHDGLAEHVLVEDVPQPFLVTTTVKVAPGTRQIHLRFAENRETAEGYQFALKVGERVLDFDRRPNWPWGRFDNRGLDRPLPDLADGREHTLRLVIDEDVATLYVDDVALNTRFNAPSGTALVLDVADGAVEIGPTRITTSNSK